MLIPNFFVFYKNVYEYEMRGEYYNSAYIVLYLLLILLILYILLIGLSRVGKAFSCVVYDDGLNSTNIE